jgi:hemerythrin-like metal-binding protein
MKWSESLNIGVAKIDGQHRKLVGMVQQLEDVLGKGSVLKEMGATLKSLVDYTHYHFKDEEDLMVQMKFPGIEDHRRQHAKLIDDVRAILMGLRGGKTITAAELIEFLTSWVVDHIEKEDKKIGAEMQRRRTGSTEASGLQEAVKTAPTQEIKTALMTLTSLLNKELIGAQDYAAKKTALLEKCVRRFSPRSLVEVTEEFDEFHCLHTEGLITAEEAKLLKQQMAARIDLLEIIPRESSLEARFSQLDALLKAGIVTAPMYDACKVELLKNI